MDRRKVILDIDGDFDNLMAVAYALESPELEVLGITTVHGFHNVEYTTANIYGFLSEMGKKLPVSKGEALPLLHSRMDKVLSEDIVALPEGISKQSAVDFMYSAIKAADSKVTICMLGAATNVAMLLNRYGSQIKDRIQEIFFAGGSYFSGTITPSACHKVYFDAEAMQTVMHAGVPFRMVSIDRTSGFTDGFSCEKAVSSYSGVWKKYAEKACGLGRATEWVRTPIALTALTHPKSCDFDRYKCEVECNGKYTYGMTVIYLNHYCGMTILNGRDIRLEASAAERNILYCTSLDRKTAMETVSDRIAKLA